MRSLSGASLALCRGAGPWVVVGCGLRQGRRDSRRRRPSRPPTPRISSRITRRRRSSTRRRSRPHPRPQRPTRPISSSATATTTSTSRARRATPPTTRCSRRRSRTTRRPPRSSPRRPIPADKKLGKLSLEYLRRVLRRRQAERPGQGRAGRPEDDPARAGRADELLRAREDLRGRRARMPKPNRCWYRPRTPSRAIRRST